MRVIVVGGGWAGCAAALASARQGIDEVFLVERTDMLLGTGLAGGIFRNNGRYTAAEEGLAMGIELFRILDNSARHSNINFADHKHVSLYDLFSVEKKVRERLIEAGVRIILNKSAVELKKEGQDLLALGLKRGREKNIEWVSGDSFIDTTGTGGSPRFCGAFGKGCTMCVFRCPSFGSRKSLTRLVGKLRYEKRVEEYIAMSGSCKIAKESLAPNIQKALGEKGFYIYSLEPEMVNLEKLKVKACQQYSGESFAENLILLDTGDVKLMVSFFPLDELRRIKGFSAVRYVDPLAGSRGNSVRFTEISAVDSSMKVEGMQNLFCAGEKAGLVLGHTEAIITGSLAGYNAVQKLRSSNLLELPVSTACGDYIKFVVENVQKKGNLDSKFTFSGSVYFERMKKKGFYITDRNEITEKINRAGLKNIF